jgi:hypothetical protein
MSAGKARIVERVNANAELLTLATLQLDGAYTETDPASLHAIIRATQNLLAAPAAELRTIARGIDAILLEH